MAGAVFNSAQQSIAGGDQVPHEQIKEIKEDVTKLATKALDKNLGRLREVAVEKVTGQPLDEVKKKLLDWAGGLADSLLEKVDLQDALATVSQDISQFRSNQAVENKLAQTPEAPDDSSNISTREPDLTFEAKEGDPNPPSQILDIQNTGALASMLNGEISSSSDRVRNSESSTGRLGAESSSQDTVSVDTQGLPAGLYDEMITVSDPSSADGVYLVPIQIVVVAKTPIPPVNPPPVNPPPADVCSGRSPNLELQLSAPDPRFPDGFISCLMFEALPPNQRPRVIPPAPPGTT